MQQTLHRKLRFFLKKKITNKCSGKTQRDRGYGYLSYKLCHANEKAFTHYPVYTGVIISLCC